MGRLLHLVQRGEARPAAAPPGALLSVPNITAHPLTASVPTSYYLMWHRNRASARADTQMTHRKESNTESGHNTKWLITANGPLQS